MILARRAASTSRRELGPHCRTSGDLNRRLMPEYEAFPPLAEAEEKGENGDDICSNGHDSARSCTR